ncbi:MAG: TonB family protein [Bacteroidales bacterium]|nr:TonB family protein [Bacteroidales bacterium]MBN2763704.1 TonB family protein [Bacteroidales bacterium]
MKRTIKKTAGRLLRTGFLLSVLMPVMPACSQQEATTDKSLSPYFLVKSEDPQTDRLPLKSTAANVDIAGVIADVTITQVYKNEGKNVLEAIYVFPASSRAAVYDMKMTIGEREIVAVIMEKQAARQTYEEAKEQGKTASLLEQMRPNVFQMNVANILPGDIIEVKLSYTEMLIPENSVYEFVFPTVVGPRYSNQTAEEAPGDGWIENPYTEEGVKPLYAFDMKANISTGLAIKDLRSTSHDVDISYSAASKAAVRLKDNERDGGNRDFILQYRLAGNAIESGILLFEDSGENYFLAMIQPPKQVKPESIPPREYIFIVDVSGSMRGFPLDVSKKLMKDIINGLRSQDRFNVLLFAGDNTVLFENSMPATADNVAKALRVLDEQQGGGGTELLPALKRALAMKGTENYSRSFVIATDGYVSIEKEAFDLISNNLGRANFFAFGIGSSVNRYIIEGMAHVGKGEPFIVTGPKEAPAAADRLKKYIHSPVLTKIQVAYPDFEVFELQPQFVPDVLSERPVVIIGKYRGKAQGRIDINGLTGSGNYRQSLSLEDQKPSIRNSALRYLWAREKIRLLGDYARVDGNTELVKTITDLGLKYNLLTDYTSFVAVDSEIRHEGGNITIVKQPLPLPEGVSNYAIGQPISRAAYTPSMHKVKRTTHDMTLSEADISFPSEENRKEEELVFVVVEDMPEYPGGMDAFRRFIADNIKLSEEISGTGIKGKVYVQFTVDTDGSLTDVKILRGLDPSVDREVLRVVKLSPRWKPGKQRGKPVKVQFVLPVQIG